MFCLFLFNRTARTEVKKFNSRRAVPVVVLNKQSRRGDRDGCFRGEKNKINALESSKQLTKRKRNKETPVHRRQQWQGGLNYIAFPQQQKLQKLTKNNKYSIIQEIFAFIYKKTKRKRKGKMGSLPRS